MSLIDSMCEKRYHNDISDLPIILSFCVKQLGFVMKGGYLKEKFMKSIVLVFTRQLEEVM